MQQAIQSIMTHDHKGDIFDEENQELIGNISTPKGAEAVADKFAQKVGGKNALEVMQKLVQTVPEAWKPHMQ